MCVDINFSMLCAESPRIVAMILIYLVWCLDNGPYICNDQSIINAHRREIGGRGNAAARLKTPQIRPPLAAALTITAKK